MGDSTAILVCAEPSQRFHNSGKAGFNGWMSDESVANRIAGIDWAAIYASLRERGYATLPPILTAAECAGLIGLYEHRERFRNRIDMTRFRYGVGEYKYFSYPLLPLVEDLRMKLYPRVAPIANEWMEALQIEQTYPATSAEFLARCHEAGQTRPTPLMLRYEAGGYNCLHQDLYGAIVFPFQFAFMLSKPDTDFDGGEFLLVEQRPRAQSRGEAIRMAQGGAILFATQYRPVAGVRGFYRANVRHGVSTIRRGSRFTLGIIFHDAA